MRDFLEFVGGFLAIATAAAVAVVLLHVANSYWNCSSYPDAQTKVIAGTCMVRSGDRWITYDSYVTVHIADVKLNNSKGSH